MNFDPKARFYLIESSSGKYVSPVGTTDIVEDAIQFDADQLRRRMKVSAKAKDALIVKINNSGFHIEEIYINKGKFLEIKSDVDYKETDILYCNATFYYDSDVKKSKVVYSPKNGRIRKPDTGKILRRIELDVIKITGKIND